VTSKKPTYLTVGLLGCLIVIVCKPSFSTPDDKITKPIETPISNPIISRLAQRTPDIDGQISHKEWTDAYQAEVLLKIHDVFKRTYETHPLNLYVKNDTYNLYLALVLFDEEHDGSMTGTELDSLVTDAFTIVFDNIGDGVLEGGQDKKSLYFINGTAFVKDAHYLTTDEKAKGANEEDEPQNIVGVIKHTTMREAGDYIVELEIPLTSDDPRDIQAKAGQSIRWNVFYTDKFNTKYNGTLTGGLFSADLANPKGWGYLQLAESPTLQSYGDGAPVETNVSKPIQPNNVTSGTVQVFAALLNEKDLADDRLKFVSNNYDLVLLSFPFKEVVRRLRQANPKLIILLFNNPYFAFGDKFWQAPAHNNLEEIAGDWLLRDKYSAPIIYGGPIYEGLEFEQRLALMDVRNAAWQKYYAAQSRKYVDAAEMDGLFIDTLSESIPIFALGSGNTFPIGYSEAGWKDSAYHFLQQIENAFAGWHGLPARENTAKMAVPLRIIFNGISRPPGLDNTKPNWAILQKCDGAAIEAFGIYLPMDKSNMTKRWFFFETMLRDAYSAAKNKKMVLIQVYADNDSRAIRFYALCTFLLIQNEWTYFYYTSIKEAGSTRWRPEWSIDIGRPKGAYTHRDGVYYREFEKGTVWVNPESHKKVVPLQDTFIDLSGKKVQELSLNSFSGTILFASGPQ